MLDIGKIDIQFTQESKFNKSQNSKLKTQNSNLKSHISYLFYFLPHHH